MFLTCGALDRQTCFARTHTGERSERPDSRCLGAASAGTVLLRRWRKFTVCVAILNLWKQGRDAAPESVWGRTVTRLTSRATLTTEVSPIFRTMSIPVPAQTEQSPVPIHRLHFPPPSHGLQVLFRIETSGMTPSPLQTPQIPVPLQPGQWPVPLHFLQTIIGMIG